MTPSPSDGSTDDDALAPAEITDRLDGLEAGDTVRVNSREFPYEVVETDAYSVVAVDPNGHRVTISQNLQSGGWTINEPVFDVEPLEE
ncbi:transcriptional regulator [Natronococcus sp. A-GB7]|uniref:transcriptional regulator n=1 Tax=Natronococcus sp. A-GB7 TaxID=3037649 RepID=UPI00241FC0C2|nr:transcriptional regulator [Natronococcus sp. A-GB7]MDG5819960.1 transcriptional regulator [Natronococcus sp. A-GB7]